MEKISAFPPMTQLRKVWAEAKSAKLIPSDMTLVEFRKIFDIFKVNANTMESYKPREYHGKITLFTSEQDITLDIVNLRNAPGDSGEQSSQRVSDDREGVPARDPFKGWSAFATEGIDLQVIPGDHFSMLREPHVSVLAERLRTTIESSLRELQAVVTP
jgi:thioesterase domain-containing protein